MTCTSMRSRLSVVDKSLACTVVDKSLALYPGVLSSDETLSCGPVSGTF